MDKYKELITKFDVQDIADSECKNMVIEAKGYMYYCPSKKSGFMYYNPSIISDEKCVSLVYKILHNTPKILDMEHIRNMVKQQATLIPESSKF